MSEPRFKLLAVDLDGTLVDSAPDIAHCLGVALEAVGCAAPGEALTRAWIGDGLETLISRALAHALPGSGTGDRKDLQGAVQQAFLPCYRDNLFVRSRLYPEAIETLDALLARGIRLCCITNKRHAFSEQLLTLAGVRDRFELLLGGDSLAEKKPSPLPLTTAAHALGLEAAAAVLVGDSVQDLRAARSAGYRFVLATYGYGKVDPAEAASAPQIQHFKELRTVLDS